ncbi:hypothetical protein Pelo_9868 [Pelomyxa schiedti]|nr:hypothetical protein Pelo_9868 [Pelomyxa schiedti]
MLAGCRGGTMPELPSPAWDINTPIFRGMTMLHIACLFGHESLVGQLLDVVGASRNPPIDPNKTDGDGLTPLCLTACEGNEAVVRMLVARPNVDVNKAGPLVLACARQHLGAVVALLECPRVDANLVMQTALNGQTALHVACEYGFVEGVKVLLQVNGIDTNCRSSEGETPLDVATRRKRTDICNLLMDHHTRMVRYSKPTTVTPKNGGTLELEMSEKEREIARITMENKRLGDSLREMNERVLVLEGKLQEKEKRIQTLEGENSVLKAVTQKTPAMNQTIVNTMTSLISATIDDFGVIKLLGTGSNAAAFHVQYRATMFNNHSTNNQMSATSTTASAQSSTSAKRTTITTEMVMKVVFNWENTPRQTLVRQKYMVECVALSLVPNHPNVIHPLGALVIPCLPAEFAEKIPSDQPFYRQLCNNKSLAILMPHFQVAQNMFVQGLKAILHIESHFVVHRDIKGDNILVDPETGKLTLIDFGEALHCPNMEMIVTATSQAWGNRGTMPPELSTFLKTIARGTSGVFSFSKCDSFALALTFWNALLPPDHKFIGNHDMSSFNTQSLLSDFPVPLFSSSSPSAKRRRCQNNTGTNENGQPVLLETVMIGMMNPDKPARLGAAGAIHSLTS